MSPPTRIMLENIARLLKGVIVEFEKWLKAQEQQKT